MKYVFSLLFLAAALIVHAAPEIVKDGKASSVIVLPENASRPEGFAASQLGYWLNEITGARPETTRAAATGITNIYIGKSFAEKKYADDLAFLKDSEGFAVRVDGNDVYLFGATGSGTIFAVYDFLEKNTDLIWPALPEGFDRVFTAVKNVTVTKANYRTKPLLAVRSFGINNGYFYNHPRTEYFALRQKVNVSNGNTAQKNLFGFKNNDFNCHNLHRYLPWDEYKEKHPEYFCLVDGIRVKTGYAGNLCFTAPGGAEEFAKNYMRDRIENGPDSDFAGIGVEDTNITCSCPSCLAPIKLPDGKTLTIQENEALFRSTQFYMWLNRIAREVKKKYPDFKVSTIAYMFATIPPAIPLEDNIIVEYCPIGKNIKQDYWGATNTKDMKNVLEWQKLSKHFAIYEYWGCAAQYPRPVSYVIQKDFKIYEYPKTFQIYSEWGQKDNAEFMSAMEFWIVCRLMWNPDQDIEALRKEYLTKTFRAAAPDMKKFFDIVRDTWYADGASHYYYDSLVKSTANYLVRDEKVETACRSALQNAVKSADHPVSKAFAQKILDIFENYVAEAKKTMVKGRTLTVPFHSESSSLISPDGAWGKSLEITDFSPVWKPKEKARTSVNVRVAHDGENLWFRFHADGIEPGMKMNKSIWSSEHWEIFLQTDKSNASVPYYHFGFNLDGEKYNAIAYGTKWEHPWTLSIRKNDTSWDAVMKIPLAGLNVKDNKVAIHFAHLSQLKDKNFSHFSTLYGIGVHDAAALTQFILEEKK